MWYVQRYPRLVSIILRFWRTFRLKELMVFPAMMKFCPSYLSMAHITKDRDMLTVFPDRIAPSAMIPAASFTGLLSAHQVKICRCFFENRWNLNIGRLFFVVLHLLFHCPILRCSAKRDQEAVILGLLIIV